MSRIATVFGASGLQGHSVVRALLKDGTFKPRAVTRDASSASAKTLADEGCEVVQADTSDEDAVKAAVTGAETVFAVTIPFASVPEVVQGANIIDASKEAGVRFLVFSTLPSANKLSGGKYCNVSMCEEKAQVQEYLDASGLPHASISTGSFLENLLKNHRGMPPFEKTDTGYVFHTFGRADTVFPFSWIDRDLGPAVVALMTQYAALTTQDAALTTQDAAPTTPDTTPAEIEGQTFVLASGRYSADALAAELAEGLGKPVEVVCTGAGGMVAMDELYDFAAEFDWYPGVEIPDPRLAKLGVEFGAPADFARTVLKPHLRE
ncbi:hypothetical protein HDZ31DRAFT_79143 [Schizophyllum fasciatum]